MKQPIKRSIFRLTAGLLYYSLKKHLYWWFSGTDFSRKIVTKKLPHQIFTHKTLLRRPLKDVELWMQENKITNLKIALKKLDGLVLEPGQTLSYWRSIGRPSRSKGYVEGMVLHNGTVKSGVGGGLCQLSNLIYWMTLHTPMTVSERWRHGYDVFPDIQRKQPFGSGATCAYPNIDLQVKNSSTQKFQLVLELNGTHLIGKWLSEKPLEVSYEIFERDHKIEQEWWGGYSRNNKIFRKIVDKKTRKERNEEFITENHALMMYSPLLEESIL